MNIDVLNCETLYIAVYCLCMRKKKEVRGVIDSGHFLPYSEGARAIDKLE